MSFTLSAFFRYGVFVMVKINGVLIFSERNFGGLEEQSLRTTYWWQSIIMDKGIDLYITHH